MNEDMMPDLDTHLHLKMLNRYKRRNLLPARLYHAIKRELFSKEIYGMKWGDPDKVAPLKFIKDRYVLPYIDPTHNAIEIGPGGGRWTRYMIGFKKLYAVDYYSELLNELKKNVQNSNVVYVKNNGTDFPSIADDSIDFLFSFGTFVHLDNHLIAAYLENMRTVLKPGANVVIQYSDKTKIMAQMIEDFSENTPHTMRQMVSDAGYTILEEDLTTLWHSSVIRFAL
jgi:ubiquinone/menaquinone biosynthesis C-methylase UbiE